ncbi:MAG: hypothetical protein AAFY60_02335 [Myxococcota bacterium]
MSAVGCGDECDGSLVDKSALVVSIRNRVSVEGRFSCLQGDSVLSSIAFNQLPFTEVCSKDVTGFSIEAVGFAPVEQDVDLSRLAVDDCGEFTESLELEIELTEQ